MSIGSEVVIYLSFILFLRGCSLAAAATPNKYIVADTVVCTVHYGGLEIKSPFIICMQKPVILAIKGQIGFNPAIVCAASLSFSLQLLYSSI